MTQARRRSLAIASLVVILLAGIAGLAGPSIAHSQSVLSDEALLRLVLPRLANGDRPGVHMWARASQPNGPGGLPTSFIVTLYTWQTDNGPEEREVINYAQYSGGQWTPARPADPGTLLTADWAWISLNLKNLVATASGQGDASQYTVDYDAKGQYNGAPREVQIEEVYAADLSLVSSSILLDTHGSDAASGSTASTSVAPSATPTAAPATVTDGAPGATAAAAARGPLQPASTSTGRPYTAPGGQGAPNTIRVGGASGSQGGCTALLGSQGYTWAGNMIPLGVLDGRSAVICIASGPEELLPITQSFGCFMVGNQAAQLDSAAGCLAFASVQPQSATTFLVVQHYSAAAATVVPVRWSNGSFESQGSYLACYGNVLMAVASSDSCQPPQG